MNRYKITMLALIPSIVHQLVHHPGIEKIDFSSVTTIASGAAYLPPELGAKFHSLVPRESKFVDGSVSFFFLSVNDISNSFFGRVWHVRSGTYLLPS